MPDRVIRDELLTSGRYWSVSIQAQQLYVHLLLVADDAARISGKNFTIRSLCFPGRPMEAQDLERMLTELIDVDLIRCYTVRNERFLFVPRFRNRRRYASTSKLPPPPNEINDLVEEKSALSQPQVIPESAPRQEERSRSRRGVGEEQLASLVVADGDAYRLPNCPHDAILALYHAHCPTLPAVRIMTAARTAETTARWRQVCAAEKWSAEQALDWFAWFFQRVGRSQFLTGRSGGTRQWRADFQWLMRAGNFAKVIEGRYEKEGA